MNYSTISIGGALQSLNSKGTMSSPASLKALSLYNYSQHLTTVVIFNFLKIGTSSAADNYFLSLGSYPYFIS